MERIVKIGCLLLYCVIATTVSNVVRHDWCNCFSVQIYVIKFMQINPCSAILIAQIQDGRRAYCAVRPLLNKAVKEWFNACCPVN